MGLRAGGNDYITKPFSLDELTARVEAHLRRENRTRHSGNTRMFSDLFIDYVGRCVYCNEQIIPFSKKEFDIIEFLSQTQLSVLSEQHQTNIQISVDLPEQTVSLAPAAVFRIVENIVSNALRYCKSKVDIDFFYSQPFLTITVTDDGKGFTAQDRAEAVDYFYKGKKEKEHFGIGLTICRILAEKHGGTISLDNAPEGGARVSVELEIK